MSDKETAGCVLAIAMVCMILAAAVVIGRVFGAAFGLASGLVLVGAYLMACVAVSRRDGR